MSLLGFGTAFADILPEGQTVIPVCAYFNNTADFLDDIAVYYYETAPGGERVDFSSLIANECVHPAYKFNSYGFYGVTADHALTVEEENYDPTADSEAYPTNIMPEIGDMYVEDTSNLERISNEYAIIGLDTEAGVLMIEPVATIKYFNDETDPERVDGEVTMVSAAEEDTGEEDQGPDNQPQGEDVFTDVGADSEYYDALVYLKNLGIIGGYPDGSFKPDNTINRAEFTKIVMGSISTPAELEECMTHYMVESDYMVRLFFDVQFAAVGGNAPDWYFNYVCQAKKMSIIDGYPDGTFQPAREINFVEGAKIITRAVFGEEVGTSEPWYKTYVLVLEEWNAIPTTITSFEKNLTRGEMAEIMYRLKAEVKNKESLTYSDLT